MSDEVTLRGTRGMASALGCAKSLLMKMGSCAWLLYFNELVACRESEVVCLQE